MAVKRIKTTRKVTPEQLGKLLEEALINGKIGDEIRQFIQAGLLPIEYLRQELKWILNRGECGNLFLTTEEEF